MGTSFADEVDNKLKDITEINDKDQLFSDAELQELAVTYVKEDRALSLLDDESTMEVIMATFRLRSTIRHQLGYTLHLGSWFDRLKAPQRTQVITFLGDLRCDKDPSIVLNWYEDRQRFRVERHH
jgi:hypothetical protein